MTNNSILEKNLKLFKKRYPQYYQVVIDDLDSESNFEIINNKDSFGLICKKGDKVLLINSNIDSNQEAKDIADSLSFNPGEINFLVGMGLGYLPLEIIKREKEHLNLIIVEPHLEIFKKAIRVVDLKPLFEAKDVFFVLGENPVLMPILKTLDVALLTKGSKINYYEPVREMDPDLIARISKTIKEKVSDFQLHLNTTLNQGKVFFKNSMTNITTTINSANLGLLENAFKDKTAIVIGAGPSLKKDIDIIKENEDKCFLCCVDTALPVLLNHNIVPDLAGAVDYHDISFNKYKKFLEQTEKVPFLYHNSCSHMILKPFRSPVKFFLGDNYGFFSKISKLWGHSWIHTPPMNSVPHIVLYAAIISGCSRIILSGLDLGYPGLQTYAEGSAMNVTIDLSSIRWGYDSKGAPVATSSQMIAQRTLIEDFIANAPHIEFLNSSEGVDINGAKRIDLKSFFKDSEAEHVNFKEIINEKFYSTVLPDKKKFIKILDYELTELNLLEKKYKKGINLCKRAINSLKKKKTNYKDDLNKAISFYDENKLIAPVIQTCYLLFARDELLLRCKEYSMNIDMAEMANDEKVSAEFGFIKETFDSRISSIKEIRSIYKSLRDRIKFELDTLEKIEKNSDDLNLKHYYLNLGKKYLEFNDYFYAEKAFEKSLNVTENDTDSQLLIAELYAQLKLYKKSLDILYTVRASLPESKTVGRKIEEVKERCKGQLSLAEKYLEQSTTVDGADNRVYWAKNICEEVLDILPDNKECILLKKQCEELIEIIKTKNEELYPFVTKPLENSLDDIETAAMEDIDRALDIANILNNQRPSNPMILELLGILYFKKGEYGPAKKYLTQASSISSQEVSPLIHLGMIYIEENNFSEALAYLLSAEFKSEKSVPRLAKIIGDIYFNCNDFENAELYYKKELKISGLTLETLRALKALYSANNNFQALNSIDELIKKYNLS
jgi:hypothetical protein